MAYQALYRKYRPKCFDDFIDQEVVKKILINSIINNKISHAYLFAGPRGIGKTSLAKIFAKAVNCLNFDKKQDVCDECDNCVECNNNTVDIIEIDAASNNGVDQIRDLKNKINIVPSHLKYKVYIIDEVHMLTTSAFNALLKTLEEPPEYVIFILATTEYYEVPETIVSRCQCFNFLRISNASLNKRLKMIADTENIKIPDDVINEIAVYSNGGLRDAIGTLDKLNSFCNGKITLDDFKAINNLVSFDDIVSSYNYIISNETKNILNIIEKINNDGYDFKNYVERLLIYVRDKIIDDINGSNKIQNTTVDLACMLNDLLVELKQSLTPYVLTQVKILDFINGHKLKDNGEVVTNNKNISREIISDIKKDSIQEIESPKEKGKSVSKKEKFLLNNDVKQAIINNALASADKNKKDNFVDLWDKLEDYGTNKKYSRVSQLLKDSFPMVVGNGYMILTADFDALIDNIYNKLNLCEELINKITNDNIRFVVVLNEEFDAIKKKYIKDLKDGITYQLINVNGDLIEYEKSDLVSKAIDIFGKDLVDIE